jgi:tetratricopeptide (TPR) repeat protein
MSSARRARARTPTAVAARPDRQRPGWWRPASIIAAGAIAYSNALRGPFIFDDFDTILGNDQIREWWRLGTVLSPERELPTAGRPLVNLSFAINYALGGFNVVGYHLVNIALHLACGLLVFGIVRHTLNFVAERWLPQDRLRPHGLNLAWVVALIWTVHPLNTEAVNYVTQRTELMMAFFYLLTLYASIRATLSTRVIGWGVVATLSCAAGMACKESMVTAPLIVVLYDSVFVFGSVKRALAARWRLYVSLAATWIVLGVLLWTGPRIHSAGFSTNVTTWTYLLNQTMMIVRYLRLSLWPDALVLNYGLPLPLTLGAVIPYALVVLAMFAATVLALAMAPPLGFAGAWLFITLAPTSSVVPIATEVGAERRMYLPLVAVIAVIVCLADRALRHSGRIPRWAPAAAGVVVVAALAALTLARNHEYASPLALAETTVARYPTSLGHQALGEVLIFEGRPDEGFTELQKAVPGAPRAHYSLGMELFRRGRLDEALTELQTFVREQPLLLNAVAARQTMGLIYVKQRKWEDAAGQYQLVLTMHPTLKQRMAAEEQLGEAYSARHAYADAIPHYRAYVRMGGSDPAALTLLAIALVGTGQLDEALPFFERAAELQPGNADYSRNLANAFFDRNDAAHAAAQARIALRLRPDDSATHVLLGRSLALQGQFGEARDEFMRALSVDPTNAEAREYLSRVKPLVGK